MAFERPTLSELLDRIQQDFVSRLSLTGAILRRSIVYVLARVLAGVAHMLHGRLDFLSRQLFPDTAESQYLRRWADIYGLTPTAASYATGTVTLTGTNGSVATAGTILARADGQRYALDADATIASGTATAAVTALLAGANGTLEADQPLTFESPVVGISSSATVASSAEDGADPETDAALLVRLKERIAYAPQGGAAADYVAWAKQVAGVTRAWIYPQELGAGTVTVRPVRDGDGSGSAIIPSAGEIAAIQAYIDTKRPASANVTVVAPTAVARDFTVSITPDNATTRAAVEAQLADLIRRDVEPGGTLLFSQVNVAVGLADDVTDFEVTSPAADVNYATGELPIMGTVTFT
jgi:uncharacterized phage protein gp47/JayE